METRLFLAVVEPAHLGKKPGFSPVHNFLSCTQKKISERIRSLYSFDFIWYYQFMGVEVKGQGNPVSQAVPRHQALLAQSSERETGFLSPFHG